MSHVRVPYIFQSFKVFSKFIYILNKVPIQTGSICNQHLYIHNITCQWRRLYKNKVHAYSIVNDYVVRSIVLYIVFYQWDSHPSTSDLGQPVFIHGRPSSLCRDTVVEVQMNRINKIRKCEFLIAFHELTIDLIM